MNPRGHQPEFQTDALTGKIVTGGPEVSTQRRESAGGKTVEQVIFADERSDAVSVQNWRKKILDRSK
jgi:hypothetical protein